MIEQQAEELAKAIVAGARPAMADVIGDRTPRQYDRADKMAEAIFDSAVRVLTKVDDRPAPTPEMVAKAQEAAQRYAEEHDVSLADLCVRQAPDGSVEVIVLDNASI